MLGKLVPLQAAKLCGLVRTDITVICFPAVVGRLSNSLVLGLLVPRKTALLRSYVTALVASIFRILFILWLDAAGLTPGIVHLVKAVPGEQTEKFFEERRIEKLFAFSHLACSTCSCLITLCWGGGGGLIGFCWAGDCRSNAWS